MKPLDVDKLKEEEYQESLKNYEKKDFSKSWVTASAYIFYLSIACFFLFTWGGCYKLYTKEYKRINVPVQESTLYTPKYK
ncbi:MAG TPA: hypothetical protein PK191_08565 [Niabella sp.]|nr:hypothetical protein [Niabella sp.]HOZ98134.1 hypothetical protein [Niabella sp.]HQW16122.1 hypothetical protein [Niabella sp.]HQX21334.1 hypothetical protein [Niabella sp.]HQX42814.1 hypothetical protein [Niabella sp.]